MSEQRLIDANKLIADVQDKESRAEQMGLPIMADAYCLALGIIETAPTVDAVPVVRCKDCKHYEHFAIDSCPEFDYCSLTGIERGDEDYCSDGERRSYD